MFFWTTLIVAAILVWLFNRWATRKRKSEKYKSLGWVAIVVTVFGFQIFVDQFGNTRIGSFMERAEYIAPYYVHLYKTPDGARSVKVTAEIQATHTDDSWTDNDGNEHSAAQRVYYLYEATLPSGEVLTFYDAIDSEGSDVALQPQRRVEVTDDNQQTWYVELTEEQVE